LLRAIAAHGAFAAGETRTDFLTTNGLAGATFGPSHPPPEVLAAAAIRDCAAQPGTPIPSSGQAPDPWHAGPWRLLQDGMRLCYAFGAQEYQVCVSRAGEGWRVETGGAALWITVVAWQPEWLTLYLGGAETTPHIERFGIARDDSGWLIGWRGDSFQLRHAGGLSVDGLGARAGGTGGHATLEAPMPGTLIKVLAEEGQEVAAQQPLVVLEAMKMEHIVVAPYDGVVRRLPYAPGALVSKGATLVELDER
jgi:3-methylcrotonyl-CoA carboxylase alpha subunit